MPESTQCLECAHYLGGAMCDAYPDGNIPDAIFTGEVAHVRPYPGDHGIRFVRLALAQK